MDSLPIIFGGDNKLMNFTDSVILQIIRCGFWQGELLELQDKASFIGKLPIRVLGLDVDTAGPTKVN